MEYKVISHNEEETIEIAQNIESEKFPNMVISLEGDLGSGKTLFTKGFANSMEISEDITSPTFNIIKEYTSGEMPLYHMDVYRLDGDITSIGLEDYYTKGGVVIIEWGDTIKEHLPQEYLEVKFKIIGENKRAITLIPHGDKYISVCDNAI